MGRWCGGFLSLLRMTISSLAWASSYRRRWLAGLSEKLRYGSGRRAAIGKTTCYQDRTILKQRQSRLVAPQVHLAGGRKISGSGVVKLRRGHIHALASDGDRAADNKQSAVGQGDQRSTFARNHHAAGRAEATRCGVVKLGATQGSLRAASPQD